MKKKKLLIISGIVVITIIAVIILGSISKNANKEKQLTKTVVAEKGNIIVKITESGKVSPVTSVNIKSEIAGEVKKLFVEEGDSIRAGDKLVLIQQESSQAQQVAQKKALFEQAKINLEDTEKNLARRQELFNKGFIAKKDVEDAEKLYKNSKIQYDLAKKQLWLVLGGTDETKGQSLLSKTLDHIIIRSPISGVVINLNIEEGEMITSGTQAYGGGGTVIMTIADLNKMIVKTDINEVDVTKLRLGQPVNIGFDAINDLVYYGRVKKIAPSGIVAQNIVVYPVEVEILTSARSPRRGGSRLESQTIIRKNFKKYNIESTKNLPPAAVSEIQPPGLQQADIGLIRPGMTADLDIIIDRADDVVCISKEAIVAHNGQKIVMLIKNGQPLPQAVTTGLEDNVRVEIKAGLNIGDTVLITQYNSQFPKLKSSGDRGHPGPLGR